MAHSSLGRGTRTGTAGGTWQCRAGGLGQGFGHPESGLRSLGSGQFTKREPELRIRLLGTITRRPGRGPICSGRTSPDVARSEVDHRR